ncbi:BnaCnng69220D, partial [Brassica napus]
GFIALSLDMNQPQVSLGNSTGGDAEEEEEEVNQHQEEAESRDQIVVEEKSAEGDDQMEVDPVSPATVFCVTLKQPNSNLLHKMSVPELCRNFSAVAWCGKLNAIACASETCARIPSSKAIPPFWIPIHILIPERPTECAVFNVVADSPRDSVQFIEWSPTSCPRALLIANFHGRITIWTQPTQGAANLVHDATSWQCEHEWRQDIAVVTKWLTGASPYRWLSSNSKTSSGTNAKSTFEEKFLSQSSESSGFLLLISCILLYIDIF